MSAQQVLSASSPATHLPDWVPPGAQHYLAHTEDGATIRALARAAGCHASTILRQIRKIEMQRDDPLVDAALRHLSTLRQQKSQDTPAPPNRPSDIEKPLCDLPDQERLSQEAVRVLRRLCETGAVLAVAAEMEKAVVVREMPGGGSTRTAIVDAEIAQAMALKNWIAASGSGRIVRYHITQTGRHALTAALNDGADDEKKALAPAMGPATSDEETGRSRIRYSLGESPLLTLSRRRDSAGTPFLDDALVRAGERLREDFELGQMDEGVTQNSADYINHSAKNTPTAGRCGKVGPSAARARVASALTDLGPGLSDVVLRCCCYLEGLETVEKRLGWSARSAKIVLRIALMRLKRHYDETVGPGGPLIG
ncbi:MAG: DUF6456 domain-containing protein [Pseudomonadota bacterium]